MPGAGPPGQHVVELVGVVDGEFQVAAGSEAAGDEQPVADVEPETVGRQDEAPLLALDEQGQRGERLAAVGAVAHQLAEGDRGAAEQGVMRRRGVARR